jgi:hypothetical protein
MHSLPILAVLVELFAEFADALLLCVGAIWEGVGIEATRFDVYGIVADSKPTAR